MQVTLDTFHELVQYELGAAERYRRYVSLVLVHSPTDHSGLQGTLGAHVRKSDAMARFHHSVAMLMGETDQSDALRAVQRYEGVLGDQFDTRYAVVTYPVDATAPDSLMAIAERRLQKAESEHSGHVVYQD